MNPVASPTQRPPQSPHESWRNHYPQLTLRQVSHPEQEVWSDEPSFSRDGPLPPNLSRVLGLMNEGVSNRPEPGGGPSTPMDSGDIATHAESLVRVVTHLASALSRVGA